jgi:hypothetical protein
MNSSKSSNQFRIGELTEPLDKINYNLEKEFGKFDDGRPFWRVVWVNDQIEKRIMNHTDEGIELLFPEVREVKKYQHIHDRYELEWLVPLAEGVETDLVAKVSYEPIWTFQDRFGNYLPPRFDACKLIIENIYQNMGKKGEIGKKYKDTDESPEARFQKVLDIEHQLFGDETPMGDALSSGDGISYAGMKNFSDEKMTGEKSNE